MSKEHFRGTKIDTNFFSKLLIHYGKKKKKKKSIGRKHVW